jgi:two-component system, OmpR family, phosphate regulon sensor histidine kinase PhoR
MARKKSLLRHLFSSYLFITLLSLVAVGWYASASLEHFLQKRIESDLQTRALLFANQITERLDPLDERSIDRLCKTVGPSAATRITVILPTGRVVGDSEQDPSKMDPHGDRPEIIEALRGGRPGVSSRYSPTMKKRLLYVAVPLKGDSEVAAVVRTSISDDTLDEALEKVRVEMALGGLVIAGLAVLLSFLVSNRIRRPISEIRRGAELFSGGKFDFEMPASNVEEISSLSESMNQMASGLRQRINTITQQRNELEGVLSSMMEGVIGVDLEERIIGMNRAAARILGCDTALVQGRSIQEVLRYSELQRFVKEALSLDGPVEKDMVLYLEGERVLRGLGTPLRDGEGRRKGALIVLNDVTRLRKLENIRRDFVANVSHEIKTPITAIKGFVETLKDGAAEKPEDVERFLSIIQKHVERLEAIVEDLLSLSRIEKEAEREEIVLETHGIREILAGAVQVCDVKASAKDLAFEIACPETLSATINPRLLEQALVNLLDNAIKYSEPGQTVTLEGLEQNKEVLIRVRDKGCGIERRHLDRLFERFYRVDQARSRKLGGTGLGLAIVKHIMQAHHGRVSVESKPGAGSTFTLHLPKAG